MAADHPRIDELRRRVQKDPASIAFAQLAEEHRRAGEFEEAIRICRAGLRQHPSYLSARVTLGRALIETGQFDDALREVEQVLRTAPDNLAAVQALADIRQRRSRSTDAGERWDTAVLDVARDSGLGTRGSIDAAEILNLGSRLPDPESRVLLQLESWLAAILADRENQRS